MTTISAELAAHQEAVRAGICDGLAESPTLSEDSVRALRAQLVEGLRPLVGSLSSEAVIDGFALAKVVECPASYIRDSFVWTAPNAARSLGLRALRAMISSSRLGVLDAVGVAVDDAIGEDGSLGSWLASLDGPARGATVAVAVSWASRAWVAVPWRSVGTVNLATVASVARPFGRGGGIVLKGRPDAVIQPEGGRRDDPRQVIIRLGAPSRLVTGLDALVLTLLRGIAPLRVVTVQQSSGLVGVVEVDGDLLRGAVDAVVATAGAIASAPSAGAIASATAAGAIATMGLAVVPPVSGQEHPGRQCWYCVRRDLCGTGGPWMRGQPRRSGGIPVVGEAVIRR